MESAGQYCTFFLQDLVFGLAVKHVQEVIRFQAMTAVPLAPPTIKGLINLRGQIVTAIDLRKRLELPERPDDALPMNVVIRAADETFSLLVDEIGDVMETQPGYFEPVPETLAGVTRELVSSVYKLPDSLLLLLDVHKTIDVGGSAEGVT